LTHLKSIFQLRWSRKWKCKCELLITVNRQYEIHGVNPMLTYLCHHCLDTHWRLRWIPRWLKKQEGQHPLTGQRAANFRLLAN